jgi:hypothetical protein
MKQRGVGRVEDEMRKDFHIRIMLRVAVFSLSEKDTLSLLFSSTGLRTWLCVGGH